MVLAATPVTLWTLWKFESHASRPWTRVLREWSSLALILIAYWSLAWFAAPPLFTLEWMWRNWDRMILDAAGLRSAIEATRGIGSALLENLYLLLYAIPPISLGMVYGWARPKAGRYLSILFVGTFAAYAMLPLVPVHSPRFVFPGEDLPNFAGFARGINTYLLDHLDISTSVFPSGHVAVAFSSAFALFAVLRQRRKVWTGAFVVASLIYLATIYGRYHYAVDGAASIAIAAVSWACVEAWFDGN